MLTEEDVLVLDIMTYSYRSFALISDLAYTLIAYPDETHPATKFYNAWCKFRRYPRCELPLNPGTLWMITSAIIVNARERWLNYLPNTPVSTSDPKWGLKNSRIKYPNDSDPSIRTVVMKIRNAISHSNIKIKVGDEDHSWNELLTETTFTFKDSIADFEIEISVSDLTKLNGVVYATIQDIVTELETFSDT